MHFATLFMRCLINVEPHIAVNMNTMLLLGRTMGQPRDRNYTFAIHMFSFVRTSCARIHHTNYFVVFYSV